MTSTILRREQRKKNSRRENTARTEEVKFATQKEPRPFSLEFRCNISKGQRRKYLHLVKRIRLCFIPVIPGSESTHERSYIREKQSVASMYTLSPEQRIYWPQEYATYNASKGIRARFLECFVSLFEIVYRTTSKYLDVLLRQLEYAQNIVHPLIIGMRPYVSSWVIAN